MRFLREDDVRELTGLSRMTRWRLAQSGDFPKPIRLAARATAWLESDVRAWMESRTNAAKAQTA
jgi:prophage regulatory protein